MRLLLDTYLWINLCNTRAFGNPIHLKVIVEIHKCPNNWFMDAKPPSLFSYLALGKKTFTENMNARVQYPRNKSTKYHQITTTKCYPYINIWVNQGAIIIIIPHSNRRFENWMMCIGGVFRSQENRYQSEWQLVIYLHVSQYELQPTHIIRKHDW